MQQRRLRFAIFGNTYQAKSAETVSKFLNCVARHGGEVCIERDFHKYLSRQHDLAIDAAEVFSGTYFDANFVVSMGGDGTLLKAANYVGARQLPIIGVNTGRLGFLADTTTEEIEATVDAIFDGNFSI
jgi:NAD+ kinase